MAKFDFEIDPEFIKHLGRLAELTVPKMIDDPILLGKTKQHAGNLYQSNQSKKQVYRRPGKEGFRTWMVSWNMALNNNANCKGIKDSESAVLKKMQEVFERGGQNMNVNSQVITALTSLSIPVAADV